MNDSKQNKNKLAKQAGIFYLLMLVSVIGLIYAPSEIFDEADASLTFRNIIDKNLLFRIGIVSNVICQLAFIFLAIKLFQLFEEVNKFLSFLLLGVVIASVPISFILIHYQLDALLVVQQKFLTVQEMQSSAQWSMFQFKYGLIFIGIFWGLWLIPFGLLIVKSGYLHRVIGYLLIAGGITYLLDALAFILIPEWRQLTELLNAIFASIAELSAIFWLLVKGVKIQKK